MKNSFRNLKEKAEKLNSVYKPIFFNLKESSEKFNLEKIIQSERDLMVYDRIVEQVEELIKCRNPKVLFSTEQLNNEVREYLGKRLLEEIGVWVYYPWSKRLVHVLDREDFIEVRTNRNQYKITIEERNRLQQKKVGIIGLSVGQSIALTLAMERTFGEIRLADFDYLELSNLNRIRSGVHNLGVSKVVIAAREIAEIDPFIMVQCYEDGLTRENMDDFFLSEGKIDILIDECDSLDIKILSRNKARKLKVPVIMQTSDRGMIDIERFDIEPDRKLLHNLIEDLDPEKIINLSRDEKMEIIFKFLGRDNISERMKFSMKEVGNTITTWPQLASSVVLGGAMATDVCRRILLNQLNKSGRFYMDFDELI